MLSLGKKLKELRTNKNLTQQEFANMLCVSDKTISSWECNRTIPDINTLFKISTILKENIYSLVSCNITNLNDIEMEVKLKLEENQFNTIFNRLKQSTKNVETAIQKDTYFIPKYKSFDNEYLRLRNENGVNILTYKNKIAEGYCEELETIIESGDKLEKILSKLCLKKMGTIHKKRQKILYDSKYEFAFDEVEGLGCFLEIEIKKIELDKKEELYKLLELLQKFNINKYSIEDKHYYDYLIGDLK